MNHASEPEYVATVERELADGRPFGNAQHINDLNDRLCLRRLSLSEGTFHAASELIEGLRGLSPERRRCFLRDPALRIGVDQALLHSKGLPARHTIDWTERLLSRAVSLLKCNSKPTLLEAGQPTAVRLGRQQFSPLLWRDSNSDPSSQCIEELVHEIVPDAHIDRPSEEHAHTLQAAVTLLNRLLPWLTPSVLNHVAVVVLVSERGAPGCGHSGFQSGSARNLPGLVLLSASELATPWRAAEALLHESLHLKFIDLEFTHSMDLKADEVVEPWTIRPPWHDLAVGEGWHPIRAMTAAHVYIGLALFFAGGQLLQSRSDSPRGYPSTIELRDRAQCAASRARFLLGALDERSQRLGLAGQHFVKWLKGLETPGAVSHFSHMSH